MLTIDISLQSYGNISIAVVPEVGKPKKENKEKKMTGSLQSGCTSSFESIFEGIETSCFYFD